MSFIGLLRTLEQMTRPPRMGHDVDVEDGAEQLAEREAEEEVSEAREIRCAFCSLPISKWPAPGECSLHEEPPRLCTAPLTEPGLTSDELVGVRGILQERYGDEGPNWLTDLCAPDTGDDEPDVILNNQINPAWWAKHHHEFVTKSSASNHVGTGAEPAPSPTIVQSAPPHPVPREQRQGTYCEDYETDGCSVDVCPDGCYHALKFRDDAVAEWIGGAVPVISRILSHHVTVPLDNREVMCLCIPQKALIFPNNAAWRQHVAPLIANALAPQDK